MGGGGRRRRQDDPCCRSRIEPSAKRPGSECPDKGADKRSCYEILGTARLRFRMVWAGHRVHVASEPFTRPPKLRYRFEHDHNASRVAREILTPLLAREWGRLQDVLLAASELVTNVVHHTDDGGELIAWVGRGGSVRLEVHDADGALPTVQEPTEDGGGRGLRIVASVADQWGAAPTAHGKVVWAQFRPRLSLVPDPAK